MKVQVQISIYTLRTNSLSEPIDEFCRILEKNGLEVETQTMGSLITGESDIVFNSVQQAFEIIAQKYDVVMDFKVSNACPGQVNKKNLDKE
jgi:uncharacterized protein YqgV (UPF0045/DUF77 family)